MAQRPVPVPDDVSAQFWDAAARGELAVQRCVSCQDLQYPPEITCRRCHSDDLSYTGVSGRGRVYSFAVVERAFHAGFADRLPYVTAMVELEEDPRVRLFTNIVDSAPGSVEVGMPVEVTFETVGDRVLPQFRRRVEPPGTASGRRVDGEPAGAR